MPREGGCDANNSYGRLLRGEHVDNMSAGVGRWDRCPFNTVGFTCTECVNPIHASYYYLSVVISLRAICVYDIFRGLYFSNFNKGVQSVDRAQGAT